MKTNQNVYEIIKNDERFTMLVEILDDTGIGEAMSKEKDVFTFFAPTDDAFRQLPAKTLQILTSPEGRGLIAAILGQLLIPGKYLYSNDLRRRDSVKTMHGNRLQIKEEDNILQLEEAHILMPGTAASNGVVFPVDKLLPSRRKTVFARAN